MSLAIGDNVFVGGFYGKSYMKLNHKMGEIKNITYAHSPQFSTYIADIKFDDHVNTVPVNLAYLYDMKVKGISKKMHFSATPSDPLPYYINKFRLIQSPKRIVDENGCTSFFYKTIENTCMVFVISTLN